ncbi:MAG: FAD-dependent oxidoreductase [Acidobacteria bacterium]|nr:FAD-dependent oxidoreductase [Acidobacteriota bacterium]
MPETADVVIIGGGIIGASVAWSLARRQAGRIVVLEKEKHTGRGSTAYSAGGVREQFSSEINIRMSHYSLDAYARFAQEMDQDIDYKRAGYMFLAPTEATARALRQNVAVQNKLGVNSRLITASEAREHVRDLFVDDIQAAAYNARDGYVDPASICQGYVHRARDMGVEFRTSTAVTGINLQGDRVTGVITNAGEVGTDAVVNACGPYLREIGEMAGVDVPARPYRRMLFITEKFSLSPNLVPLTIDMATGFYFRDEGRGLMIGLANASEPSSFDTTLDWDYLPTILEHALHRIPTVEDAEIGKGWAGLYDITPDHHALLGAFPERPNFHLAGGFSGHGVMHAPAAGCVISEMILDGEASTMDVSMLAPARVREGHLLHEQNVI